MTDQSLRISTPTEPAAVPVEKASWPRRFFAYAIDLIILGLAGELVSLLSGIEQAQGWWAMLWGIIGVAIPAIYFIWPYSTGGQTLGKRALKIKVVSIDGSSLTWGKGILRTAGYVLSAAPLGLGFLWAIWDADKQAGHDKIAGTCVVRASVAREELRGTLEASSVRRTQRRWLLGLGIPALLILGLGGFYFFYFVQRGVAEVREMGPWPGPEIVPEDLVLVDLSDLGLEAGQIQNARDEETWAGGSYEDGHLVVYGSGLNSVLAVWALRYETTQAAGSDYRSLQASAAQDCPLSTYAFFGNRGVVHCQFSDAYIKTFWNDCWIVHVVALEGMEFTPDVLVDRARDAIAAHWKASAQPSPRAEKRWQPRTASADSLRCASSRFTPLRERLTSTGGRSGTHR